MSAGTIWDRSAAPRECPDATTGGAADGLKLEGERVALVGRFSSTPRRQAQRLIRQHGGFPVPADDPTATLVVLGESSWLAQQSGEHAADKRFNDGRVEIVSEGQLWQRLGLVDPQADIRRLYTPAMLATLLGLPVAKIRHWHLRGLLVASRTVHRLPYFDFQQVAAARRLKEWLADGVRPTSLRPQLASLARFLDANDAQSLLLSVVSDGRHLLVRDGQSLIDALGQRRIDFEPEDDEQADDSPPAERPVHELTIDEVLDGVVQLEDEGQFDAAIEMCRTALIAHGPKAELCFTLAELLYRIGDLTAARERYWMAIELDEDYVEARANLGCVLAEVGQVELAVAAFEGALAYHGDFPDVHYHLARTLDESGRAAEAESHWRKFLERAPESPWADEARTRLQICL